MAVRVGGQKPGDLGPPFRNRQVRHNSSQGFRNAAPYDSRTGNDSPLWPNVAIKIGVSEELVMPGDKGIVTVWRNPINGSEPEKTKERLIVYLDWKHGQKPIAMGEEVVIYEFKDEKLWRFLDLGSGPTLVKLEDNLRPGDTASGYLGTLDADGCFVESEDEITVEDIHCYAAVCAGDTVSVYVLPGDKNAEPVIEPRYIPYEPRQINGMCATTIDSIAPDETGRALLRLCNDEIEVDIKNTGTTTISSDVQVIINLNRIPPATVESCDWTCEWETCSSSGSGGGGSGDCCCALCNLYVCVNFFPSDLPVCQEVEFDVSCCCDCDEATLTLEKVWCTDNESRGKTHYIKWTLDCDEVETTGEFTVDFSCCDPEVAIETITGCDLEIKISNTSDDVEADVGGGVLEPQALCQCAGRSSNICPQDLPEGTSAVVTGSCLKWRGADHTDPYLDVCVEACKICPDETEKCWTYTVEMECDDGCVPYVPPPVDLCTEPPDP